MMSVLLTRLTRLLWSLWLLALPLASACAHQGDALGIDPLAPGRRVLFVGNSLTEANDLHLTVAAIADLAGDTFQVRAATAPGVALIDHLNGATDAPALIENGVWDVVVLQQGPTPAGICRDSLVLWTRMFDPLVRQAGATPALLMTWPSAGDLSWLDDVRVSFSIAADAVNGIFIPAGEAWRVAWQEDPDLPLYSGDGFHPSRLGSFLAALTIYAAITGRDVRTLPPHAFAGRKRLQLPEETVILLQRAAHNALTAFRRGQQQE